MYESLSENIRAEVYVQIAGSKTKRKSYTYFDLLKSFILRKTPGRLISFDLIERNLVTDEYEITYVPSGKNHQSENEEQFQLIYCINNI